MKMKIKEIWKKIPNYTLYEASSLGRLKTFNWKNKGLERIMKPAFDGGGYLRTVLKRDSDGKLCTVKVHRIIAQTFIPNPENKKTVNHKNFIKGDNRVENLEWNTQQENTQHACDNNRYKPRIGELNGFSKLTEKQVLKIRANYTYGKKNKQGETKQNIADRYGVSFHLIKSIVLGNSWKYLL